jgi:hypothetical protein
MNKKIVTLIVIVLAVLLAIKICTPSDHGELVQTAHDALTKSRSKPKAIEIFIDASGSMKGYVDGVQGTFKENVPELTTKPLNTNTFGLSEDSVRCFTINNTVLIPHKTKVFCDNISNCSLFGGASTEVHNMFDVVASRIQENPGRVGVIVTDGILSFPHSSIVNNPEKNRYDIGILKSNVTSSMTKLVNQKLSVAIVQYKSEFNGRYYYTYHDKQLNSAVNHILNNRPYYFIMVGNKENLDAMFNYEVLPKGYTGVYMYNTECAHPEYTVIRAQKSGAIVNISDNIPVVAVGQKGPQAPYFYIGIKDFSIASYLEPLDKLMEQPLCDHIIIDKVEKVDYNDVNTDKNLKKNVNVEFTYLYKITLKSNEELRDISSVKDKIYFISQSFNAKDSEIENDEVEDLVELEGKTFMFSHLIEAIERAYVGIDPYVASIEVSIEKK